MFALDVWFSAFLCCLFASQTVVWYSSVVSDRCDDFRM
jgi:hypothetical protein